MSTSDRPAMPSGGVPASQALDGLTLYHKLAAQHLHKMLQQLFKSIDENLTALANQTTDNHVQDQCFAALRELQQRRAVMAQTFTERYSHHFREVLRQLSVNKDQATKAVETGLEGGLSLLDENELEQSLAIDGLVAKNKERFTKDLTALELRFAYLIPGYDFADERNPLGPGPVCFAFRDALQGLPIELKIKLVLYKLFDQALNSTLRTVYDEINAALIKQGVLPDLKAALRKRSHESAPAAPQTPSSIDGLTEEAKDKDATAGLPAPAFSGEVFENLQRLLNLQKYGGDMPTAITGPAYSVDEMMQSLTLLQQAVNPQDLNLDIRQHLKTMAAAGDGKAINPLHDNTIDAIAMIFEFILDEPTVDDSVKVLIIRLQIPILKIAINDKAFLGNKEHPARRLVNELAEAGMAWAEKTADGQRRMYNKMEYIVNRILTEFKDNAEIFPELLGEFTQFVETEKSSLQADKELTKALRMEEAIRVAAQTIEHRVKDKALPENLVLFLSQTWQQVLRDVYLNEGDSDTWWAYVNAVDELLWTIEPMVSVQDRLRLARLLPAVLTIMREGMTKTGFSPVEIDAAMKNIESFHLASVRRPEAAGGKTEGAAPPRSKDAVRDMIKDMREQMAASDDLLSQNEPLIDFSLDANHDMDMPDLSTINDGVHDEYWALAETLELGGWFDLVEGDKTKRVKLAWKSSVMGQYVFVDRTFKVAAEKTIGEVAALLRERMLKIAEDIGIFDKAVDAVVNRLSAPSTSPD